MEGTINLILSISQTKQEYLPKLIEALDEHQTFASLTASNVETIISTLNTLLNAHQTRFTGLKLLNAFVAQCSLDTLEAKGGLWITICTRSCNQKTLVNEISVAYEILCKIITRSEETQQLSKLLTSSLLSKVIESCTGHVDDVQYQIIGLMELCLKLYPGPTGTQRQIIQKIIARYVDSTDGAMVNKAAKCQLLLQQARGGGVQGVSLKDSWAQYQLQLIGSIHECFDLMFSNTVETCDVDTDTERLNIPRLNLSDEPITKANQLTTRCVNLIKYLDVALIESFPVAKAVQPARILNLINRGLDVNCLTIAKNLISDNVAIGMLLPELHVILFKLVNSLILILGSNLLVYCRQITKFIMQSLKWSDSGEAFGAKRPYISVRIAAYDTLIKWCQMSKSGSTIELIIEHLIKNILKDSTPYENEITLQVLPGSRKHLSKKARKRLHSAHNEASNIAQKHSNVQKNNKNINNDSGNEILCAKALECLSEILKAAGCFIKPNVHKILQDHLILLAIATASSTTLKQNLYTHWSSRRYLYEGLKNLVICAHYLAPPPVQYTIEIISAAQIRDSSSLVRNLCASYIHDLEKLIHPNKDCLYFPIDKNELENLKYSAINLSTSKESKEGGEQSEDDEDSDMRLILSQSSTSSETVNLTELDVENENQTEVGANEKNDIALPQQKTEILVENSKHDQPLPELNTSVQNEVVIPIETETNKLVTEIEVISLDENMLTVSTNETQVDTIVINELSENEKTEEGGENQRLANEPMETINIDSDDNVIHEITDDDEPAKKKNKSGGVVDRESTDVIDCEDMESCFVDEVNENIIEN